MSLALAVLAFAISFVVLRKKTMPVRLIGGAALGLAFVGALLALLILGGDR